MRCWEQVLLLVVTAVVVVDADAESPPHTTALSSFLAQLRNCSSPLDVFACAEKAVDKLASDDEVAVTPGVAVLRVPSQGRSLHHDGEGLGDALGRYLRTHVVRISLPQLWGRDTTEAARSFLGFFSSPSPSGKSQQDVSKISRQF